MTITELEHKLAIETEVLNTYKKDYERAKSAYLSELRADCERSEGSGSQEARRERHQQELRDNEYSAKTALDAQSRKVDELNEQYLASKNTL